MNQIKTILFLCLWVWVLMSCNKSIDTAGAGGQTTNGITGIITDSSGIGAVGVIVTLYPENFNPSVDKNSELLKIETGSKGEYFFKSPNPATYNLQAFDPITKMVSVIPQIKFPGESDTIINNPEAILTKPGAISIAINELGLEDGGVVYLQGTNVFRRVASVNIGSGIIVLEAVPPAVYTTVYYQEVGRNVTRSLISDTLAIASGDTLHINAYSRWLHSYKLSINTSATGANIQNDVYYFPLFIRLDSTTASSPSIFELVNSDGSDIRFSKPDGSPLSYELEKWDPLTRSAQFWVQVDTIYGNSTSQFIHIHMGNELAYTKSNGPAVFDSSVGGFKGVWHMSQSPYFQGAQVQDASETSNHAAVNGANPLGANVSPLNQGVTLDGQEQFLFAGNPILSPQEVTLSFWLNTVTSTGGRILGMGNAYPFIADPQGAVDRWVWMSDSGNLHFGIWDVGPGGVHINNTVSSPAFYNDSQWHYISAVFSNREQALYVDGVKVDSDTDVASLNPSEYLGYWSIGHFIKEEETDSLGLWTPIPSSRYFAGSLDEVRVVYKVREDAWVKLCYENQKSDQTLVKLEGSVSQVKP